MSRNRILLLCALVFVGVNIFLIATDKTGKVERKSYIKNWTKTVEKDMFTYLHKEGVFVSVKEEDLYFDNRIGSFQEFLVEQGDYVNEGDELYSYRVHNYYETKGFLEREVEKINGEINAIKTAISSIESHRIPSSSPIRIPVEEKYIDIPRSVAEANLMKEQYRIEKENELAKKNAELEMVQAQLSDLQASGDTLTVISPYEGKVTMVSKTLAAPILTIEAEDLHIEAEVSEKERPNITEGLAVEIKREGFEEVFKGTVTNVSDIPNNTDLNDKSMYEFQVSLSEEAEIDSILPGYHVDLKITTDEALRAAIVKKSIVRDENLWKMTNEGNLIKQKVETGIHMKTWVEITKGVEPGELVATDPIDQFRAGATFVTPLKIKEIPLKKTMTMNKTSRNKNFALGILSR